MLWIIGGIILAVVVYQIGTYTILNDTKLCIILLAIFVCIPVGLFGFYGDYEEPILVKEIELVSLNSTISSEGESNMFYVSVSASNVYTYRYEVEDKYNLGGKSYETDTVSENVTEVEAEECTKPVLKKYEKNQNEGG